MTVITPQELHRKIQNGETLRLLDVRTPREFAQVHVPGAVLEPLDSLDAARIARELAATPGAALYVLCHSGMRAKRAIEMLAKAGATGCVLVEGGTQAWAQAGLPVERQNVGGISLDRQVRIVAGALVFIGTLLGAFWQSGWLWVPGFIGAGLICAGITDKCGLAMVLARMPWNRGPAQPQQTACEIA